MSFSWLRIFNCQIFRVIINICAPRRITDYTIKLNNRKVLAGIAEAVGAEGKQNDFCVAIDKLDKIGQEKVNQELLQRGFTEEQVAQLNPILGNTGSAAELLDKMKTQLANSEIGLKGIDELQEVFSTCKKIGIDTTKVAFDVTLARGLNYYTGAIFEVKANNVSIGSISGGGRYDDLTGVFGLEGMSGVGISFGVDRIYDVMEELDLFPKEATTSTEVLFVQFDIPGRDYCLPLLKQLRDKGMKAEMYPDTAKLKKQMNYANQKGVKYVVLAGTDEMESQQVTLKNMESGKQELVAKKDLADTLLKVF